MPVIDFRRANPNPHVFTKPYGPAISTPDAGGHRFFTKPYPAASWTPDLSSADDTVMILPRGQSSPKQPSPFLAGLGSWSDDQARILADLVAKEGKTETDLAEIERLRRERALHYGGEAKDWFSALPQWSQVALVLVGSLVVVRIVGAFRG